MVSRHAWHIWHITFDNYTYSVYCTYTIDVTKPTVTGFIIPSTSASLDLPISSFTATDDNSVTGFKLTETATAPGAGDAGWSTSAPISYTFSSEGTKTLYAWAKDADGNVSTSLSAEVVIILPNIYTTESISICEGNSYEGWTITGQYERTLTSVSGADSIVTTNLTVNPISYVNEDITIYEGGNYLGWTEAGQYERTLTSLTGCDSVVTTNLTVALNKSTIEDISICQGDSYEGWTTTGQYQRILFAASGADSIVTTNLTVNPISYVNEDITIYEGGNYLGWTEARTI